MVFFEKVTLSDQLHYCAASPVNVGLWVPAHIPDILIETKAVLSEQNIGVEFAKSKGSNNCFAAVRERLVAIDRHFLRINYSVVPLCFPLFCFIPFIFYTLLWRTYLLV